MAKLTLSVDSQVIARAKDYAKGQGISVSSLVEAYLSGIAEPSRSSAPLPPVLSSLRGVLKSAKREDYRRHLESKHR